MANLMIFTNPPSDIEYLLPDGRVTEFELRGVMLYDERDGTVVPGWRDELVKFVVENELDVDHDGHGLHAFVLWMMDEGLLLAPNRKPS